MLHLSFDVSYFYNQSPSSKKSVFFLIRKYSWDIVFNDNKQILDFWILYGCDALLCFQITK
jgi:hypothetical protein